MIHSAQTTTFSQERGENRIMIRVIFTSEAAAAEYAANENGIYFPLPDGTFKVLVMED